jgi:hypothetical protein
MSNLDQEFRIKRRLAEMRPRQTMASMAMKLGLPYGSVVTNVYGHKNNAATRSAIAGFLGVPVEELFGANGDVCGDIQHG